MILEKGCAERGCACYDVRVDEGVEVMRELTDEEILAVFDGLHAKFEQGFSCLQFARAILAKACNPTIQGNTCG